MLKCPIYMANISVYKAFRYRYKAIYDAQSIRPIATNSIIKTT